MLPGNYPSVIGRINRMLTVLLFYLQTYFIDKRVFDLFIANDMIGSDTGLSAVKKFTEYDTFRRKFDIGSFIDDAWAFSSEFEYCRSKSLSRMSQYFFSNRLTARKENEIVFLIKKFGVFLATSCDDNREFPR